MEADKKCYENDYQKIKRIGERAVTCGVAFEEMQDVLSGLSYYDLFRYRLMADEDGLGSLAFMFHWHMKQIERDSFFE
jgi:hypothetical protein